jgi:hypothetical protein
MGRFFSSTTRTLGLWRIELDQEETNETLQVLGEAGHDSVDSFVLDHCTGYCDVVLATVLAITHVQYVQIHGGSDCLYALGMGLARSQTLMKLSLTCIDSDALTESAAYAIAKGLTLTKSLQELRFRLCKFDSSDLFHTIANGLMRNKTLQRLELLQCRLHDEEGANLMSALQHHPVLKFLRLGGNCFRSKTMEAIAIWMMERDCKLEKLDFASQHVQNQDVSAVVGALRENASLKHLDLSGNKLGDSIAVSLWEALRHNKTLDCLCLQQNHFSDHAAERLSECLPYWSSLRSLKLYGHPYSAEISKKLLGALEYNSTLEDLSMCVYASYAVQKRIRHQLHLNRAGRGLCRDPMAPAALWPYILARINQLWKDREKTKRSVLYGLLRDSPGFSSRGVVLWRGC